MFSANSSQVSEDRLYVEDVFSTWLYTGTGSAQTITNGIDLSGKGGLVWCKDRTYATSNCLVDTARGTTKSLFTNLTDAQNTTFSTITAFNSNGFTVGTSGLTAGLGDSAMASWTFRKAPKFFDVVTYTGDGTVGRNISHNLGVAPGCMIIKCTNTTTNWAVYHRSTGNAQAMNLNSTNASGAAAYWASTSPTATQFTLGAQTDVNGAGNTYVAYLFAHDTTSDGIIQCGSFVAGNEVNLGWEPQWVLAKNATASGGWEIIDNMRGFLAAPATTSRYLMPNNTNAEADWGGQYYPTATGFKAGYASGTYIYIAIRRGPMRTPTSGTSVFSPVAVTPSSGTVSTTNFPTDMMLLTYRPGGDPRRVYDRLRGIGAQSPPPYDRLLTTNTTDAEADSTPVTYNWWNTGFTWGSGYAGLSMVSYAFRRAPSFFDVVCYTGTGSARTINHNLGVAPELVIIKSRSNATEWIVGTQFGDTNFKYLNLNTTASSASGENYPFDFSSKPTATSFGLTSESRVNGSGRTFVSYLFASCPGVSKVGSYTGNGSSQTINCGFAAGARFVMIKRTDSTGSWWVWDVARGLVSGNDPALQLNSTAAETTGIDSIDPDSSGFIVNQDTTTNINVSSGTYVYLAIS